MTCAHFRIEATWHHCVWGFEAVKTGVFAPPALVGPAPSGGLQAMIAGAETALESSSPEDVNGWASKDLDLQIGRRRLALTPETFIPVLGAQLPSPPRHHIRHPAHARRAARKTRLRVTFTDKTGLIWCVCGSRIAETVRQGRQGRMMCGCPVVQIRTIDATWR